MTKRSRASHARRSGRADNAYAVNPRTRTRIAAPPAKSTQLISAIAAAAGPCGLSIDCIHGHASRHFHEPPSRELTACLLRHLYMSLREIPTREWPAFLDKLGREHRGWLATLDRGGLVEAREQPLES